LNDLIKIASTGESHLKHYNCIARHSRRTYNASINLTRRSNENGTTGEDQNFLGASGYIFFRLAALPQAMAGKMSTMT